MKKRILSLLLIVTMLVSMVPSVAFATEGESYCYNLARLQWGQWSSQGVNPSTLTDWDSLAALDEKGNYFNRTTDPFKFYGQSSSVDWRWTGSSHNEVGPTIDGSVGAWGGIVIRVGKSAVYDVSMRLLDNAAAAGLDFYLAPVDVANPQSAKYYLGSSNYTETTGTLKMTSFGEQYLEAGDYAVIFKMTKKGTAYTAISNVTLNWVTDEKPAKAPENYCYNLARLQYGQWSDQGVAPSTLTDWDALEKLDNWHNRTTDPFMFYGQSSGIDWRWTKSSASGGQEIGPTIHGAAGEWGGIVIRVGESALYDVSMRLYDSTKGSSMDFYLAPLAAENPQRAEYYLGSSNFTESTATLKVTSFGEQYLEKGDYAVIFKIKQKGSVYTAISNVSLTWKSYEKPVAPPKNFVYNLGRLQWGQWSDQGIAPNELTDWDALEKLDNWHNRLSDPFMYYGASGGFSWTWTKSSMGNAEYGVRGPSIVSEKGEWGGINIRVSQTALYDVSVRFYDYMAVAALKVYLAPCGAENPRDKVYYMGTAKPTSDNAYDMKTVTFGQRYLPEGDYTVVFENDTGRTDPAAAIANVALTWVSNDPSERLILSGDAISGVFGEKTSFSFSASLDGEPIDLSELEILRVDSLDRTVATVEKKDGTYSIVGQWKGETAIRVSAEHQGEITAINIPVTVTLPEGYLELNVEAEDFSCKIDESALVPITYYANREPIAASELDVSVEIEDDTLADISLDADGALLIQSKLGGETKVTVTVAKDGVIFSKTFPLVIDPTKLFFSLHNGYQGPWSDSVRPIDYFVDYDMFDKNPDGELPSHWRADTEPWKLIAKSGGMVIDFNKSFRSVGYMISGGGTDWMNLGIKVREGGVYNFAAVIAAVAGGGPLDIYISPIETPQENWGDDRYYVGILNGSAGVTTPGVMREIGNVTLEAGEYNVYCKVRPEMVGTNGVWLIGLCLNRIHEHQLRLSGDSKTPIMETANGSVPLTVFYDGAEIDFTDVTDITVTAKNEEVATATVVHTGADAYLDVTGVTPGFATFTVTATYNGVAASKDVSVEIVRKDQIKFITLTAEKQNLNAGERAATSVTATCYDGTSASLAGKHIYYETSNPKSVAIDAKGEISAREKGESIVRAWLKTEDGDVLYDEILITVGNHSPIQDVKLSCGDRMTVGTSKELVTTAVLSSGATLPQDLYTAEVTVTSGDDILRIENGTVYADALGSATVQITVDTGENTAEFTKTVTVVPAADLTPKPESLVLNVSKTTLSVGERAVLTAGAYDTDGKFMVYDESTMVLEYNSAILGYENGKLIARASGTSEVKLTVAGMEKTVIVTVDEEALGSAAVNLDGTLYVEKTAQIDYHAYTNVTMRELAHSDLTVSFVSANEQIATVDASGAVTGVAAGDTTITVNVYFAGETVTAILPITVYTDAAESIEITVEKSVMKPDDEDGIQLNVNLISASGSVTELDPETVSFESLNEDLFAVDAEGLVSPKGTVGSGKVRATYHNLTAEIELTVKAGKTASTFYTESKRQAAKKNVEKYKWAKDTAQSICGQVDQYVGEDEWLSNLVTSQSVPRNLWAAYQDDPNYQLCRYCGTNMVADTGETYPYLMDIVNYPWKLQCPTCRRRFPSNDFEAFYELGLDEHGFWNYELSKQNGSHLLKNDLYPEKGEGWAVDDGFGYKTGKTYETGYGTWDETWTFVAHYNAMGIWSPWITGGIPQLVRRLTLAYTYSGKEEYGRSLAVLMDRIADVYPDMDMGVYEPQMLDNGWYGGKFVGGISDTSIVSEMVLAYDAVFDLYDDPTVLKSIQKNAARWNYDNKDTPAEIREHIENDFLLETKNAIRDRRISGNNGMHQMTMAYTGVVLDRMPESKELIDWSLYGLPGTGNSRDQGILVSMTNTVNRDGHGDENSISYNSGWISNYATIADALAEYDGYPGANLYKNPKFVKMLKMNLPLTMARRTTLTIGDSYGFGDSALLLQTTTAARAILAGCDDPEIAQMLYFLNGNQYTGSAVQNLYLDTDELAAKIKEVIEVHGEYSHDKSTQMTGLGMSVLRGGTFKKDNVQNLNTQRAIALWYGSTYGHGHTNSLDLAMYAYGLNVMPSFGYPTNTMGIGSTVNWERATISHNTVQVNGVSQVKTGSQITGDPLHFDDSGKVKLTDARNLNVYASQGVDEYRRTAIMVEASDADAYTVDFFRIKGGNEHVYSFHSQSNEICDYEGLDPIYQEMGTYAGPDIAYGPGAIASGHDSFYDVYRTVNPQGDFAVTFKVEDFRKVLKEQRDLYLRVTQLNDFELDDVSWASAVPPNIHDNAREIKYLLARRNGTNLDSLFTTVIEPYDGNRFIETIETVPVTDRAGNEVSGDVKAVKVTLKNGREDYIVYATDNTVRYRVDDTFDFIGFVGVISYQDGEAVYRYLHDGVMLDGMYGTDRITGTVSDFTRDMAFDNFITVNVEQDVDASDLIGKTVYINNSTAYNAAYPIHGAVENRDGTITLDIGEYTLINSQSGSSYKYNISKGETFVIPLTTTDDPAPIVAEVEPVVVTVGGTLEIPIHAESPIGKELTYQVVSNTNGAAMVGDVLHFSPSKEQVGSTTITVEVSDGIHTTTVNIGITVYPATSGGGGGGGGSSEEPPVEDDPIAPGEKFVDLGNHAWAKDAIYRLVEAGVIKGVADDKFAPAAQITRADFAILLVRAWNLTADEIGTYDDVAASDYFANEVGIAAANGIVNGVGEGKFAPRAPITREQMMVMLHRTLTAQGIKLDAADEAVLATFSDADAISDYAVDAVKLMVANGYIQGSNGKINPQGNATRAEVAVLLDRILNK